MLKGRVQPCVAWLHEFCVFYFPLTESNVNSYLEVSNLIIFSPISHIWMAVVSGKK